MKKDKYSFGFAYYIDTGKADRECGVMIESNRKELFTDKYHYTIVDAPNNKDYSKNMIAGSSRGADVATCPYWNGRI
jgi:elongation factor 1-alpha